MGADHEHDDLATHWSVIERLDGPLADASWDWLIHRYRGVVHSVIRAVLGREAPDADLDGFWTYLFESRALDRADRCRSFRRYLLGVARNYALQRLGSRHGSPLDAAVLPAREDAVGVAEDRAWAESVIGLALERMSAADAEQSRVLRAFYGIGVAPRGAADLAGELGRAVNAMHQTLHRARQKFRVALETELRETVSCRSDLDDEVEVLLSALRSDYPGLA